MPTVTELQLMREAMNHLDEEKLRAELPNRKVRRGVLQYIAWMKRAERRWAQRDRDRVIGDGLVPLYHWTTPPRARLILEEGFRDQVYSIRSEEQWLDYVDALMRGDFARVRTLVDSYLSGPTLAGVWMTDSSKSGLPYIGFRGPTLLRLTLPADLIASDEFFGRAWKGARDFCIPSLIANLSEKVDVIRTPGYKLLSEWHGARFVELRQSTL